ncbi:uncharacterized protein PADG_07127 [Paracoccidioides brasiliensis Pb18]|uniref:Uncharacterized protein n=1 Tax=Paracoccidioides brasiliensis (strain Pb18) TaxID=502780 RepID=C1GIP1_PARBD|nr:uncharacterized protein PADG_07127 [Paracoccidioides brasiliensis Pb18]EEH42307.2 hypothetical protein PADG_07127 [Paracoccidioides brasiliensis Pb18]ODH51750.1 hypothetical protein GX48_01992 [Paracoccidioides brasiliensis]
MTRTVSKGRKSRKTEKTEKTIKKKGWGRRRRDGDGDGNDEESWRIWRNVSRETNGDIPSTSRMKAIFNRNQNILVFQPSQVASQYFIPRPQLPGIFSNLDCFKRQLFS